MKTTMFSFTRRAAALVGMLCLVALVWVFFHRQINYSLGVHFFLNSRNPREEAFYQLAGQSPDPVEFLNRCWATGKITLRELVAAFLKDRARTDAPSLVRAEPLMLAGATDADASVRELALATLDAQQSSRLFDCIKVQLEDLDPILRLLGLDYLRKEDPRKAVPIAIPLLDDPDLRLVTGAEVALMHWSGEDYGVRTRLAIPSQQGIGLEPSKMEAIREGVKRRKEWWQLHSKDYPASPQSAIIPASRESTRLHALDFTLEALDGRTVRLSDFRGKVVLLNFWATWCTACLAEIPDLIALQNKVGQEIAIIGVALDGVPNEHEHAHGPTAEDQSDEAGQSLKGIRAKVDRAAKARGINYTVLLDPSSSVGGQFNGGELPTTVIIDAEGRVRRRFIGERNLKVFEAMLAEAVVKTPPSGP